VPSSFSAGLVLILVALTALASLVPSLVAPGIERDESGSIPGTGSPEVVTSPPPGMNGALPTMGWNSWNAFGCQGLTETLIRETADAMVSSGLMAAGYDTLTLDDCWSAVSRDASGNLTNDPVKFPSGMKAIGDYIHSRGLKYGIYASIGTATCTGGTAGSLDHEFQDVAHFASWGVDYIKADRCNANGLVMKDIYARWRDAIVASGRPIVLSASDNTPTDEPWAWGPVTAHQWRMSGDISDDWGTMMSIVDRNVAHAAATAPGTFNDPDMLEVGNGGMTDVEYRAHFGLWALMSAPLIAGNDVRGMSDATRTILTNPEVIAVDQDTLGFQVALVADAGNGLQVWSKPLAPTGARAVGLLNRGATTATITVDWGSIALAPGNATVRDLWDRADRGSFQDNFSAVVPAHEMALLRVVGTDLLVRSGFLSDQRWTYMANEQGPVERNSSFGGHSLGLDGTLYAEGFGTQAPSAIEFRPDAACRTFVSDIGVDDEVGNLGSVMFQVWGDGVKLYDSGVMTGTTPTATVNVSIAGVRSLRLQVVALDSTDADHADWAIPRVACDESPSPNRPPQARFTATRSRTVPWTPVTFDAGSSADPDGTIVSYAWDFGDGFTGNGVVVGHAFAHSGRFSVVLTVVDNNYTSNAASSEITVDFPPIAVLSTSLKAAPPGRPIQFNGFASTDSDGIIVSYAWEFGDGQTAAGISVTHAYADNGTFIVRLTVADNLDGIDTTSVSIDIGNRAPTVAFATPQATIVLLLDETQTLVVVASDLDGDPLIYSWILDGHPVSGSSGSYEFVGSSVGSHVVRVLVSDGSAEVGFTWAIEVNPRTPPAQLPIEPFQGGAYLQVFAAGALVSLGVVALVRHVRRREH
jgi:alpha-galactosidase